jgi:hypothetical protein
LLGDTVHFYAQEGLAVIDDRVHASFQYYLFAFRLGKRAKEVLGYLGVTT